jgi:hypothetical protein
MKAFLKKFEPLEDGTITVTLRVQGENIQEVVSLYRKEITLAEQPTGEPFISTEKVMSKLTDILTIAAELMQSIPQDKTEDTTQETFLLAAGG